MPDVASPMVCPAESAFLHAGVTDRHRPVFAWIWEADGRDQMLERDLIHRAQRGDRQAAEDLCRAHWRGVYRLLYARLGNRSEAEDLTQETFARLWRALPTFAGEDIGAYVRTIALNLMSNHLRDSARRAMADRHEREASAPSAEHEALQALGREEIEALLRSLHPDQAKVLRLRLVDSLSVAESARRMGRSAEAVRSLQYRALQELRTRLGSSDPRQGVR